MGYYSRTRDMSLLPCRWWNYFAVTGRQWTGQRNMLAKITTVAIRNNLNPIRRSENAWQRNGQIMNFENRDWSKRFILVNGGTFNSFLSVLNSNCRHFLNSIRGSRSFQEKQTTDLTMLGAAICSFVFANTNIISALQHCEQKARIFTKLSYPICSICYSLIISTESIDQGELWVVCHKSRKCIFYTTTVSELTGFWALWKDETEEA